MRDLYLIGLGQISAAGQGMGALRRALSGETRIHPTFANVETASGSVRLPVYQAPEAELPGGLPESIKRRMARISRMCFVSLDEAMHDAFGPQLEEIRQTPARIGLVVGSAMGCLELANQYQKRVIFEGAAGASPSLFASSIHNSLAAHLSISFGIQGPTSTVATMEQTAAGAFGLAANWLEQGHLDHVAVVIGEEVSDYHRYFLAHTAGAQAGGVDPESDACTSAPGEGFASFVFSRRQVGAYARLMEVSMHRTSPPDCSRYFAAVHGAEGQWSGMRAWLAGKPAESHLKLFGSTLCSLAFEVLCASVELHSSAAIACVQLTDDGGQSVTLSKS